MLKNTLILTISCLVSVLFAELAVRIVFDPIDYLATSPESDPVLNHRIAPGASGHDDWGYRNKDVPEAAEILAIGDSMTYGIMAKSFESWPARLEEITGRTTYNAALGGYGPLHYLHILKTRAPELSPDQVIVMIYPGNDLLDAYNLAYSNDHWQDYRQSDEARAVESNLFVAPPSDNSITRRLRNWLARNSVLYRLITQTPVFDTVRQRERLEDGTNFQTEHLGVPVVLDPKRRFEFANTADARIQEAMDITARALDEMAAYTAENGIRLHVAIMPVREHLFFELREGAFPEGDQDTMLRLAESLEQIEAELTAKLDANGIPWTNLRPILQRALVDQNIYPPTDGHPNALGYDIVAQALAADIGAK